MNILISDQCNRKCSFCFSGSAGTQKFMNTADLEYVVDFLKRSGIRVFKCLGGEPTLHPDFINIVKYVISQGLGFFLFTNGSMSDDKIEFLSSMPRRQLGVLCNITHSSRESDGFIKQRHKFLTEMPGVNTSLTIDAIDFEYDYIFDTISKYQLSPVLRVGISHPIYGEDNKFISLLDIKKLKPRFNEFIEVAKGEGIRTNFDCGMPLCLTDNTQLCDVLLDVGVDLKVWSCFPLRKLHSVDLKFFENVTHLKDYFVSRLKSVIELPLPVMCDGCTLKSTCSGGCLVHKLNQAL